MGSTNRKRKLYHFTYLYKNKLPELKVVKESFNLLVFLLLKVGEGVIKQKESLSGENLPSSFLYCNCNKKKIDRKKPFGSFMKISQEKFNFVFY